MTEILFFSSNLVEQFKAYGNAVITVYPCRDYERPEYEKFACIGEARRRIEELHHSPYHFEDDYSVLGAGNRATEAKYNNAFK